MTVLTCGIPLRAIEKLWALTDRKEEDECWTWRGYRQPNGYGWVNVGRFQMAAHRLALILSGADVPAHLDACHTCDNRTCVNPRHLYAGTRTENMADCTARGRHNKPRGEEHWRARLTAADVQRIRALRRVGLKQAEIARMFDIHPSTVSRISRRIWRQEVTA